MSHSHAATARTPESVPPHPSAADPGRGAGLDTRTSALERLSRDCRSLLTIEARCPTRTLDLLHATAVAMHSIATSIIVCEDAGLSRPEMLPTLASVRALHARSPFAHRLQTWPRGYPGDFETVEWLCDARNRADIGTVPWAIEQCALQSPLAQQHRNKVGLQARAVLSTLVANPRARIASIGCGGCRDLSMIQDYVPCGHGSFVLIDADPAALEFAGGRLGRLGDRCELVQGRVPKVLSRRRDRAGFDLIVAGGLFDYLPDRWAVATLTAIRERLAPGGQVFLSNIASGNPFRPWIEYLADWWLIERHESDLQRLLGDAGFAEDGITVTRDSSGLALLVEARVEMT
jgi:extracellular factor (EF) 3-hydroxypalmitic acid methyl ester biosynthesis protein